MFGRHVERYLRTKIREKPGDFSQGKLQKTLSVHLGWTNVLLVEVAISQIVFNTQRSFVLVPNFHCFVSVFISLRIYLFH